MAHSELKDKQAKASEKVLSSYLDDPQLDHSLKNKAKIYPDLNTILLCIQGKEIYSNHYCMSRITVQTASYNSLTSYCSLNY